MNVANFLRRGCVVFALLAGGVAGFAHAADGAAIDAAARAKEAAERALKDMQRRAREAPLARDEVELFPELRGELLKEDQQDRFGQAVGDSRFIVRIRQVINLSGNNPFHTRQPLLNFNGAEVGDLAALIAIVKGNTAGGGTSPLLADCIRTVPMNVIFPNTIWSGNFDLNPTTLACTLRPPGVPGSGAFSIVADSPSTPANTTHCVGGIPGAAWARDPAGAVCIPYALGSIVNFGAVSTAGRKITVQFQVTAGNPPTLRVIAITPLN